MRALKKFFTSIKHAWRGICDTAAAEQSFRIQLVAAAGVFVASILFPLKSWERVAVLAMVGMVLVLEMMNTVVERLADALHPRTHIVVREIKDITAGAVAIAACIALLGGILIFWPHIFFLGEQLALKKMGAW